MLARARHRPLAVHALEPLLAQILPDDPANVRVVASEQTLEEWLSLFGKCDHGAAPGVAERLPQAPELVAAAIAQSGKRDLHIFEERQHVPDAVRLPEQPRLAEGGDCGPPLERSSTSPASHLPRSAAKSASPKRCRAIATASRIRQRGSAASRRRSASTAALPPASSRPRPTTPHTGRNSSALPKGASTGPSAAHPRSVQLICLLGDDGGELEVPPRTRESGVLEQERLPLSDFAQRLPVRLCAGPVSRRAAAG